MDRLLPVFMSGSVQTYTRKQLAAALNTILQTDIKFEKLSYRDLTLLFHLFNNERPELIRRLGHHMMQNMTENIANATSRIQKDGLLGMGIGPRLFGRVRAMSGSDTDQAR